MKATIYLDAVVFTAIDTSASMAFSGQIAKVKGQRNPLGYLGWILIDIDNTTPQSSTLRIEIEDDQL